MRVLSLMVDVRKYVQIPMNHLSAPVIKDIYCIMVKGHVQVLITDFVLYVEIIIQIIILIAHTQIRAGVTFK